MTSLLLGIILVPVAIIAFLLWRVRSTYNTLMALETRCDTAFADIDVQLKHRANLIPGLVETVKGFAGQEKALILGVTEARQEMMTQVTAEGKIKADAQLKQKIGLLLQAAQNYPDIKSSPHFRDLEQQLVDVENRVTASRRFYNLAVEEYNTSIKQWPGNVIAAKRRLTSRQPYDLGIERVMVDEPLAIKF